MSNSLPTTKMIENYRAYLSVLAEMRKMFFVRDEDEIIRAFLVNLVHHFGFSKVWYGRIDEGGVIPSFHAGPSRHFTDVSTLSTDPTTGPEFPLLKALRDNAPQTLTALDRHPNFAPWRDFAIQSRVRGLFTIPLEVDGVQAGGFVLYSEEPDTFDPAMIDYLETAVEELSRILSEKRFWEDQKMLLRQAKERAEIAAETKSRFLADMSHEIRTPMTAILGYTEMLSDPTTTEAGRREAVSIIRNNAEFLLEILNDVLDFSKIEADKLKVEIRRVALVPILNEVAQLCAARAKGKGLYFKISNSTPFPDAIYSDSIRLKQILLNLIGNAVKFTSTGGIEIALDWKGDEQALSSDLSSGFLGIEVRDSGIGISPEAIGSLFDPFEQADSSTTRRFGGTGLGLPISRRLVGMLGGEISAESQVGRGTTFRVVLPQQLTADVRWIESIETERREEISAATTDPVRETRLPLAGRRLLLAEDGKDNQRLFKLVLTKAGAEVVSVENGQEALETALKERDEGYPFDLILMDMQMPVMDGYTAVSKLREIGYDGPVLALTAHVMPEEKRRCLNVGCDDHATKPILREALIEAVLRNLDRKHSATTGRGS